MANQSVLELAVGTGKWDAGLKKAKSALDNFTQANGGLQQALDKESQKMQQFVRMMGGMESTAKTAKGQMNDYKSTIEQLTMQYNRMSEAQKKVVGQDYLQAIEQMKQKYQSVNKEIQDMNRSLKNVEMPEMKGGGLFSGMGSKMEGALAVFGGNIMTKATGAVASLGSEMADMVKQGVEMAKAGEGIRIAFGRLGRGDILQGLREATHGTVTDLELMKAAVKFNDFKLPLDELGTMLAFAQQKAKDTGQSVDYMVDSIVTGLGRKSLMILDNLGLSATEVKDKMKETGDMTKAVGAIIREQMEKAGDYVETAADRAAQANVSLQNKMEELGRKFGPVEEASNQLWTSMKIGILDVVGGPLARLLNGLTEAGRLKNMLNNMNGESGSGNTKVDQQLKKLNVIKKAGGSDYIFNSMLSGMLEDYNRQIMELDKKIKDTKKLSPDQQASKFVRDEVQNMSEQMKALGMMRDQLAAGAKELSKPVKVDIQTDNAIRSVDELKVKLAELQAQRKKVKAGSDEAKRLDTEIRQVKADIKLQNPDALKTTHTTTPQEKAAEMVANAERTYAETLQKSAIRMEVGMDSTLDGKKNELSAQERLFDAYNDAYATYKDPKYKDAASEAANKIKSLAGEVKQMEDAVKASKIKWEQGASGFNTQTMGAWLQGRQGDLSKAEYGSTDYNSITANIADMNTIKTILEQSMAAGIDAAQFNLEPLWEKVFDGENIDDKVWQGIVDTINEKLKELNIEPIKIDFKTGGIKKVNDETKKLVKAANTTADVVGSIGDAFNAIEDPAAKVAGTVAQAIATIAAGYATATTQAASMGPWAWVAFAATGLAQMFTMINAVHSATGYAQGGIVKGNSYSGDNVPALVDGSQMVGLNAGEVVLTAAQTNNLAAGIQNGGSRIQVVGKLSGEQLFICAERWAKRTGKGEFVTWR